MGSMDFDQKMCCLDDNSLQLSVHMFYHINQHDLESFGQILRLRQDCSIDALTMEKNVEQPQVTHLKKQMISNSQKIMQYLMQNKDL